jgi:hypothetical protein
MPVIIYFEDGSRTMTMMTLETHPMRAVASIVIVEVGRECLIRQVNRYEAGPLASMAGLLGEKSPIRRFWQAFHGFLATPDVPLDDRA